MADVLLIHGAWHGSWCWDEVADRLRAAGHNVVAIDLPGHDRPGDRSRLWNRPSQYLKAVTDAASVLDRPVLVGHSMGGYLVQRYLEDQDANEDGAQLSILVSAASSAGARRGALRAARRRPLVLAHCSLTLSYAPAVATHALVREIFFTDSTADEIVEATHRQLQNESALAILAMQMRGPRPQRLSSPVRVIAAQHDLSFAVDDAHELAEQYSTECHVIDGGHDLMLDTCWPELADLLLQLISVDEASS